MAILTINSGSSSLKLGLYADDGEALLVSASVDGIGGSSAQVEIRRDGSPTKESLGQIAHAADALEAALPRMLIGDTEVKAVGHRIVHGGPKLVQHQRLTPQVLQQMQDAVHFAPLHIPPALELIQLAQRRFPDTAQVGCFDTAFHQTLPSAAYTYAVPPAFRDAGVRRFGFHGLSYESTVHLLGDSLPQRTVIAHLGSGASACAVSHGKSVDTSMGVSPTGGFPMATRPGDLDPEVVLFLLRSGPLDKDAIDAVEQTLNHQCGLLALANETDMRKLLERGDAGDPAASLAVEIFCRSVAKTIASYAAVLGGLDLLAFSGGIGEHSAPIRGRICRQLDWMGVKIDPTANQAGADQIAAPDSRAQVRVVKADENGRIAAHTARLATA